MSTFGPLCIFLLVALTLGKRIVGTVDKAAYKEEDLTEAIRKSEEFGNYNAIEKDAVKIVYLYTIENTGGNEIYNIYRPLNRGLREGMPVPFFQDFAKLLKAAFKILRGKKAQPEVSAPLYRGMTFCDGIPRYDFYLFNEFVSTSTEARVAFSFTDQSDCTQRIFMVFENAVNAGLLLKPYSAYPNENEVLLESGLNVNVEIYLNRIEHADANIRSQTSQIAGFPDGKDVQVFIKFRYVADYNSGWLVTDILSALLSLCL